MLDDKLEAKYRSLIGEYAAALKWTRDKLVEKEDECRRLKLIILDMTKRENWEKEEVPDDLDP